jgi:hypothetical protein
MSHSFASPISAANQRLLDILDTINARGEISAANYYEPCTRCRIFIRLAKLDPRQMLQSVKDLIENTMSNRFNK